MINGKLIMKDNQIKYGILHNGILMKYFGIPKGEYKVMDRNKYINSFSGREYLYIKLQNLENDSIAPIFVEEGNLIDASRDIE